MADKDSLLRRLIRQQQHWSACFDSLFPAKFSCHGNADFFRSFVPARLLPSMRVYDVGGGRHPCIDAGTKARLQLEVIGLDISAQELLAAPSGLYDRTICADIQDHRGQGDADLILCQALLEHVRDTTKAFKSLSTLCKPGGLVMIFVPSRNAIFARLNLLLPEEIKRKVLYALFPVAEKRQGFPSYYHQCTPASFRRLAEANGFEIVEERFYYQSDYFSFFLPFYMLWRMWTLVGSFMLKEHAAETFCMALRLKKLES